MASVHGSAQCYLYLGVVAAIGTEKSVERYEGQLLGILGTCGDRVMELEVLFAHAFEKHSDIRCYHIPPTVGAEVGSSVVVAEPPPQSLISSLLP